MSRIAVVLPTNREECVRKWLREWSGDFADNVHVIIVEDNPSRSFDFGMYKVEHYAWDDFDAELGDDSWIIPRRNAAINSYGFLKARQSGADLIWNLNDDCYPEERHRGNYLKYWESFLDTSTVPVDPWWNTIAFTGGYPRGYPYEIRDKTRKLVLHHGLWSGIPDLDGKTQLENPNFRLPSCEFRDVVPSTKFFPMSSMNIIFRAELVPIMYQLLMGQDLDGVSWGFSRFDDIWSGLFMKKIVDHLGWACTSGAPSIYHDRASDPHRNAEAEAPGIKAHEELWPYIQDVWLEGTTPESCYLELADAIDNFHGFSPRSGYWKSLAAAMRRWVIVCG